MMSNNINANFEDLRNPEIIQQHINELKKVYAAVPHNEILTNLIEQVEPLDFQTIAFPQIVEILGKIQKLEQIIINPDGSFNTDEKFKNEVNEWKRLHNQLEKLKVTPKHYQILSIEEILRLAEFNKCGLCKNQDFIYLYNGAFWKELEKEAFQKFLGSAAEKLGVEKYDARYFKFRHELFKQFLSGAYLPTPETNTDKVLINLKNGTFEISANGTKLRPFKQSDFITYQLPFDYNPKANAPLFKAYLDKVLPDIERQKVLAEYLGSIFIKHGSNVIKEEKALILYGSGANGKSVFFEIVTSLFGRENVSNYSLQNLTEEKGFYRARIANKLINYASEINGKLEASFFKAMVSGEPVEACLKYGQPFTMENYAKFIFNCNELPKDVEHTNAYFRRFLIIPFDVTIPPQEQDKNLHTKIIKNELSGVFNWVLDGLNRLLKEEHFSECKAAKEALERYKTESDSVKMFIDEYNYKVSISKELPLQDLYKEYKYYCENFGNRICSQKTFSDRLKNAGFEIIKKNFGRVVNVEK